MPLISCDEKEILKEWSNNNHNEDISNDYLFGEDIEKDSYFTGFNNEDNIYDYCFDSVPELKSVMADHMDRGIIREIETTLQVAIMKGRYGYRGDNMDSSQNKETTHIEQVLKIPDYIYTF